jgi:hypothetical protein
MQHRSALFRVEAVEKFRPGRGHVLHTHIPPNLPPLHDTFALARPQVAHSIRAQYAAAIF